MKAKRLFSAAILLLFCVCIFTVGFTACSDSHIHTYAESWSTDAIKHWKAATCEHDVKAEQGAHQWSISHLCTVCAYQGEHSYSDWSLDLGGTTRSKTCVCGSVVTESLESETVRLPFLLLLSETELRATVKAVTHSRQVPHGKKAEHTRSRFPSRLSLSYK